MGISMQPWEDDPLIKAIIRQESGGDPNAVSPKGARGLMQIMPATARDPGFGVPDVFTLARQMGFNVPDQSDATVNALLSDPKINEAFGRAYFGAMKQRFPDDQAKQLAAYNAGPGAVEKHGGVPPFAETQNYVKSILGRDADRGDTPMEQMPMMPQQGAAPQPADRVGFDWGNQFGKAHEIFSAMAQGRGARTEQFDAVNENRRTSNRTMDFLEKTGFGDLAKAVSSGAMAPREAMALVYQQREDGRTALQKNYEYLVSQGMSPQEALGALRSGTSVNINSGSEVGTIPQGYELFTDPATGARSMRKIEGGPADEAAAKDAGKAQSAASELLAVMDGLEADPQLGNALGFGSWLPDVPGYNTSPRARMDQLTGKAFLQAFESLKGGGQITQIEGEKATAAMARLKAAQSEPEYREALKDFRGSVYRMAEMSGVQLPDPAQPDGGQASEPDEASTFARENNLTAGQKFRDPESGAVYLWDGSKAVRQ